MKTVTLTYQQIFDYVFVTLNGILSKEYDDIDTNNFIMQWLEEPVLKVKKHMAAIEKTRNGLITKHSTEEKNGKPYLPDGSNEQKTFDKAFEKVLEKSVDILLEPSAFRSMDQIKERKLNFSGGELMTLKYFMDLPAVEASNGMPAKEKAKA